MKAIETKYLGPTNYRGSRCKAWTDGASIVLDWDHSLNSEGNHRAAAVALYEKMGWHGTIAQGGTLRTDVFVFVDEYSTFKV